MCLCRRIPKVFPYANIWPVTLAPCRAFGSEAVTTRFYDLSLLRLGFEHSTFGCGQTLLPSAPPPRLLTYELNSCISELNGRGKTNFIFWIFKFLILKFLWRTDWIRTQWNSNLVKFLKFLRLFFFVRLNWLSLQTAISLNFWEMSPRFRIFRHFDSCKSTKTKFES